MSYSVREVVGDARPVAGADPRVREQGIPHAGARRRAASCASASSDLIILRTAGELTAAHIPQRKVRRVLEPSARATARGAFADRRAHRRGRRARRGPRRRGGVEPGVGAVALRFLRRGARASRRRRAAPSRASARRADADDWYDARLRAGDVVDPARRATRTSERSSSIPITPTRT